MFGARTGERDTFGEHDLAGLLDALVETQAQLARAVRQRDHARAVASHVGQWAEWAGAEWAGLGSPTLAPEDDDGWRP